MHHSHSYIATVLAGFALAATSCKTTEENHEYVAGLMLGEARQLLAEGRYAAARDTILAMRQQYPLALQTRTEAILTLDSVEMLEARDSLHRYEAQLTAAREAFSKMQPRINGATNEDYYTQQRLIDDMEFHFDELCAKVKFYARKIDIDSKQ